ncbi:MAG: sigma 54-interacting transcriptional regulator [Pasteurellaceae bacterium]|nr:sigma 54-interacting transcriptional regulator [Pasteurellaceae bacterium]
MSVAFSKANQFQYFDDIVAQSGKMQTLLETAKTFASLDAPLLIEGETGTGKELLAKACHHFSQRKQQKFIAVNCAGLPAEDAESEMFGRANEDNAHTGFFEYANGGTVLLDSVAELPLLLQAKLLRFLNDGTFRRVGEEQEHYSDVRVICTSQTPLQQAVHDGKMRSDLFHRLAVLTLHIPPLRERQADIPFLTDIFLQQISQTLAIPTPKWDQNFINYLLEQHWQGNVRELYNALYRACCLTKDGKLTIEQLNLSQPQTFSLDLDQFGNESLEQIMHNFEAMVLTKFYQQYPSSRKLANRLGLSHTAVANKLKLYGIGK